MRRNYMNKIEQIIVYENLKKRYPRHTVLDTEIETVIDEIDPAFRKKHSDFFECKDVLIDTKSVDGILDWLYGCMINPFGNLSKSEINTISKIIKNIEKHTIKS